MAKYLDDAGVTALWAKCKSTFIQTVNNVGPDANGDVTVSGGSGSGSYLPLSGGTMTGPLSWTDSTALPQKTLSYILGIDSFANGGQTGWESKDSFLSGCLKTSARGDTVIQVDRDTNVTNKNGYWAGMSTQIGPSNSWWHILSMDWSGNTTSNWISQLALPTQDTKGMYYRKNNSGGTAIDSSTWHKVYTDENTYRHNITMYDSNHNNTISFQLVTADSNAYTTASQVWNALNNAGYYNTSNDRNHMLSASGRRNTDTMVGVGAYQSDQYCFRYTSGGSYSFDYWANSYVSVADSVQS